MTLNIGIAFVSMLSLGPDEVDQEDEKKESGTCLAILHFVLYVMSTLRRYQGESVCICFTTSTEVASNESDAYSIRTGCHCMCEDVRTEQSEGFKRYFDRPQRTQGVVSKGIGI